MLFTGLLISYAFARFDCLLRYHHNVMYDLMEKLMLQYFRTNNDIAFVYLKAMNKKFVPNPVYSSAIIKFNLNKVSPVIFKLYSYRDS